MRSRIVRPREMRETFKTEVRGFSYAFVLPAHGRGWEDKVLHPERQPGAQDGQDAQVGHAVPAVRQPVYIEVAPRP